MYLSIVLNKGFESHLRKYGHKLTAALLVKECDVLLHQCRKETAAQPLSNPMSSYTKEVRPHPGCDAATRKYTKGSSKKHLQYANHVQRHTSEDRSTLAIPHACGYA
jgi:hypothetical protein